MESAAGSLAGSPAKDHVPPEGAEEAPTSRAELLIQLESVESLSLMEARITPGPTALDRRLRAGRIDGGVARLRQ